MSMSKTKMLIRIAAAVFVGFIVVQTSPICDPNQYRIKGESSCEQCPRCPKGSGVNRECQRFIPYNLEDTPHCVACKDGETYSNYVSTDICHPCSPIEDKQREITKCTKFHDRAYECDHGYFEDDVLHMCNQQCCYCGVQSKYVNKCKKDNMTDGMLCEPTRSDGKCDKREPKLTLIPTTAHAAKIAKPIIPSVVVIPQTSNASLATTVATIFGPTVHGHISETRTFPAQHIISTTEVPPTGQESISASFVIICVIGTIIILAFLAGIVLLIRHIYKGYRRRISRNRSNGRNVNVSPEEIVSLESCREKLINIVPKGNETLHQKASRNSMSSDRSSQVLNDSGVSSTRSSQAFDDSSKSLQDLPLPTPNQSSPRIVPAQQILPTTLQDDAVVVLDDSDVSATRISQASDDSGMTSSGSLQAQQILPTISQDDAVVVLHDSDVSSTRISQASDDLGMSSTGSSQGQQIIPTSLQDGAVVAQQILPTTLQDDAVVVLDDSDVSSTRISQASDDSGMSSNGSSQGQRILPTSLQDDAVVAQQVLPITSQDDAVVAQQVLPITSQDDAVVAQQVLPTTSQDHTAAAQQILPTTSQDGTVADLSQPPPNQSSPRIVAAAQQVLPLTSRNYAVIGLLLSTLRHTQRLELAIMLDIRGVEIMNNWLEIGLYVAGSDKFLVTLVRRCHESYYGGGSATLGMFNTLSGTFPHFTVIQFLGIALKLKRYDIIEYFTVNNVSNEKFADIPEYQKECIADLLERRIHGKPDWESFADSLGFNCYEIEHFRMNKKIPQQYSPTLQLLMVLSAHRPQITVEDLQCAAVAMGREDVRKYLEHVIQDQHNVPDLI